jgi:hypothetical protein
MHEAFINLPHALASITAPKKCFYLSFHKSKTPEELEIADELEQSGWMRRNIYNISAFISFLESENFSPVASHFHPERSHEKQRRTR